MLILASEEKELKTLHLDCLGKIAAGFCRNLLIQKIKSEEEALIDKVVLNMNFIFNPIIILCLFILIYGINFHHYQH